MITHTIYSYWIPSQNKTKWKLQIYIISQKLKFFSSKIILYMKHIFCSCFIRCVYMKWIRPVLLMIESGHDFVHRRTSWNQYTLLSTSLKQGYNNWKPQYLMFLKSSQILYFAQNVWLRIILSQTFSPECWIIINFSIMARPQYVALCQWLHERMVSPRN